MVMDIHKYIKRDQVIMVQHILVQLLDNYISKLNHSQLMLKHMEFIVVGSRKHMKLDQHYKGNCKELMFVGISRNKFKYSKLLD
jgi:hypothetical protein